VFFFAETRKEVVTSVGVFLFIFMTSCDCEAPLTVSDEATLTVTDAFHRVQHQLSPSDTRCVWTVHAHQFLLVQSNTPQTTSHSRPLTDRSISTLSCTLDKIFIRSFVYSCSAKCLVDRRSKREKMYDSDLAKSSFTLDAVRCGTAHVDTFIPDTLLYALCGIVMSCPGINEHSKWPKWRNHSHAESFVELSCCAIYGTKWGRPYDNSRTWYHIISQMPTGRHRSHKTARVKSFRSVRWRHSPSCRTDGANNNIAYRVCDRLYTVYMLKDVWKL